MKRVFIVLLLLIGCGLGVGVGIIGEGRMVHLRRFTPQFLPEWSQILADDAGVLQGQSNDLGGARAALTVAHWQFEKTGSDGPTWRVGVRGEGIDLNADLQIPVGMNAAFLKAATGEVDLESLQLSRRLGGLVVVDDFNAHFTRKQAVLTLANGQAHWLGAQLDGHDVGLGEITLTSGEGLGTGWEAQFSISGGVVDVNGQIAGRFNSQSAMLDVTIADAGAMPENWQNILSVLVRPNDGKWVVRRRIDLGQLLVGP